MISAMALPTGSCGLIAFLSYPLVHPSLRADNMHVA